MPVHLRGELLGGIADAYRELGETDTARMFYSRITRELNGSEYAKRASAWLTQKDMEHATLEPVSCIGCHVDDN